MNAPAANLVIPQTLLQLSQRIRWLRWHRYTHRLVWFSVVIFLVCFLADTLWGLRTFDLRVASLSLVTVVSLIFATIGFSVWYAHLDRVGLAHLLEKKHPELAERLVSLVQLQTNPGSATNQKLIQVLQEQTQHQIVPLKIEQVCPLQATLRVWLRSLAVLLVLLIGLCLHAPFPHFVGRFISSWATPLVPFAIEVVHGNGFALRGQNYEVKAFCRIIDPHVQGPSEYYLIQENPEGHEMRTLMTAMLDGSFALTLENLQSSLRCQVNAADVRSETFEIHLIEPPRFTTQPRMLATPPRYQSEEARSFFLNEKRLHEMELLQYTQLQFQFQLDRAPSRALLMIKTLENSKEQAKTSLHKVSWSSGSITAQCDLVAVTPGHCTAELMLEMEHGLTANLSLGDWDVRQDEPPHFTQGLHLQGQSGDASTISGRQARIAPKDVLRLQSVVEDHEGLGTVEFEYRINEEPARILPWLDAAGQKQRTINDWLPIPPELKEGDRFRFRIHARDRRRMRQGELSNSEGAIYPPVDLWPQVVTLPVRASGQDSWIELHVDSSVDGFLKQQIQTQSKDVQTTLEKIQQRLASELQLLQKLEQVNIQQSELSADQTQQANKIRTTNQEIISQMDHAATQWEKSPELSKLAEHLRDLAEMEMSQSDQALERFAAKEHPNKPRASQLTTVRDAVKKVMEKLDRMQQWNQRLAEDRIDQWQLDKLARRQKNLADQLAKAKEDPTGTTLNAKVLEEIRQEQLYIAKQMSQLQNQSRLLQQALEGTQTVRVRKLTQDAKDLAQSQREMQKKSLPMLPANADRLRKLAKRQALLAQEAQPFARQNQGPLLAAAQHAADALQQLQIETGIQHQKDHENRLQEWLETLLPGMGPNALREQVQHMARAQKTIREDLEQLGQDLPRLNEKKLKQRLQELVARQRELHASVTRLPVKVSQAIWGQQLKKVESLIQQAADQLASRNAVAAFELMESNQQMLQSLAGMLPATLLKDRSEVKNPELRARIDRVEHFARQQEQLRKETEKELADWMKAVAHQTSEPLREQLNKLASNLKELSQKGLDPATKTMAEEAAHSTELANKAMQTSQDLKEKGHQEQARAMDVEALRQMEKTIHQLEKSLPGTDKKSMSAENPGKMAQILQDSENQMRLAVKSLPNSPLKAQEAMQGAAQRLVEAANQAQQQAMRNLPSSSRSPASSPAGSAGKNSPRALPFLTPLTTEGSQTWGDLPGEMKTRMLQDFRGRFGEKYAERIQFYFERLADDSSYSRNKK